MENYKGFEITTYKNHNGKLVYRADNKMGKSGNRIFKGQDINFIKRMIDRHLGINGKL